MAKLDIFEKRLLIVSGKGGVGKSTICAALALGAAKVGKNVLVIEMDDKERISRLFGSSEVGYEGAYVQPNICIRNLQPMLAMDEFVQTEIKSRMIARQILGSQIYRYFVAAAPGLKEFVTLGKIARLSDEQDRRGRPKYDIIILDAPASGHGIAFLRVPFAAAETVKVGWVKRQSDHIIGLITDPSRTMLNIVTLPEEMPVNETLEMCERVEELLGIPIGYIIINSVYPQVLNKRAVPVFETMKQRAESDGLRKLTRAEQKLAKVMFECHDAVMRRRELNEFYISKLKRKLSYEFIKLPFVFTKSFDINLIQQVSGHMLKTLQGGRRE